MSEKRKHSDSPRSKSSKFKLKTKRASNTEENTVSNGETTPKRYSTHSTPIRKSNIINNVEDSPEMDYRCSPIYPSSQRNEVLWSWHSPKEQTTTNNDLRTPKRSSNCQKRRIADSPLMFPSRPAKVEKQESNVNEFISNFEQFYHQPIEQKPVPCTSENLETTNQNKSNTDKKLETSEEGDLNLVYPDDNELEESLVRCSQMVEEEFLAKIVNEQATENASSLVKIDEKGSHLNRSQITGLEDLINIPIEKSKPAAIVKPQEKMITIPDDSFDEYLSQFREEDFKKIEIPPKPTISRPNNSSSKKSLFSNSVNNTSSKLGIAKSCSILDTKKINASVLTKTKSFECNGKTCCPFMGKAAPKEPVQMVKQIPESYPRKFFKSKSHSEPFTKDPKPSVLDKKPPDAYSYVQNTQNERKIMGKSFKCKIYSDTSLNPSTGSGSIKVSESSQNRIINLDKIFGNAPLSNHRSVEGLEDQRKDASKKILFTKEEIERKRIEALMKLEAKRRMLSSKVQTTTRILPISQSIKR